MMTQSVFALLQKHQSIDDQLRQEQSRMAPDFLRVSQLKKLKLAIKDRLQRRSFVPGTC